MSYPAQTRTERRDYVCPHYHLTVQVETRVVFPSDFFREYPARIMERKCSGEFDCVLVDKSACPMHLQQIRLQTLQ